MNDDGLVIIGLVVGVAFLVLVAGFLQRQSNRETNKTKKIAAQFDQEGLSVQQIDLIDTKLKLRSQMASSANWFFCIAVLSIVNTLLYLGRSNINFLAGLGVTQLSDVLFAPLARRIFSNSGMIIEVAPLLISVAVSGFFVVCGLATRKGDKRIFIIGMVFYGIDALIVLYFQNWLALGVHVLLLVTLYTGIKTIQKLEELVTPVSVQDSLGELP